MTNQESQQFFGRAIEAESFIETYKKANEEDLMKGGPYTDRLEQLLRSPSSVRFKGEESHVEEAGKLWRETKDAHYGVLAPL